jgi:hypothetical protein
MDKEQLDRVEALLNRIIELLEAELIDPNQSDPLPTPYDNIDAAVNAGKR